MATRIELQDWEVEALEAKGGTASIVEVVEYVWQHHGSELKASGKLFYTWQYDMRCACTKLREQNVLEAAEVSDRGEWRLHSQST